MPKRSRYVWIPQDDWYSSKIKIESKKNFGQKSRFFGKISIFGRFSENGQTSAQAKNTIFHPFAFIQHHRSIF